MNVVHVLRIECDDQKGLIHKITGPLFKRGLNIIQNDEFVDTVGRRFFMRTEFSGSVNVNELIQDFKHLLPARAVVNVDPVKKRDAIIFATKEHHCLADLLVRQSYGELNARVLAVVSNHNDLRSLAERFEIPYHYVPYKDSRQKHEAAIIKILDQYNPEFLVLAKYMRILSDGFIVRYKNRVINIHHSFLPAFVGANPYKQAADRGVKIIGATAHFVSRELDQGPIIAQGVIPVDHSHSVNDMAQAGRDVEKIVLARALKLAFENRIFVSGNKTILFD